MGSTNTTVQLEGAESVIGVNVALIVCQETPFNVFRSPLKEFRPMVSRLFNAFVLVLGPHPNPHHAF